MENGVRSIFFYSSFKYKSSCKSVAWGFSCVTPTDITGSFMAKMHKQRFEKASCNPTLKALLCEHFSFLQLDLVWVAKSMGDLKGQKTVECSSTLRKHTGWYKSTSVRLWAFLAQHLKYNWGAGVWERQANQSDYSTGMLIKQRGSSSVEKNVVQSGAL